MTLTAPTRARRLNGCSGFRECWSQSWLRWVNTSASVFGSTLALTQSNSGGQEFAGRLGNRNSLKKCELCDGVDFGSEQQKKRNVDVENEIFDVALGCANDTSSVLVWYSGLGS